MRVPDMTLRVMMARSLNTSGRRVCRLMSKRVGASLRNMRARGIVHSQQWARQRMLWEVA